MGDAIVTEASVSCLEDSGPGNLTRVTYPLPNTDVSGIGVILAFLLSAYISWLSAAVFYLFGRIPQHLLNNTDLLLFNIKTKASDSWISNLRRGILVFSTQQIVFGIVILAAGLATMSSTVVFDFNTIVYLGWLASNGHLSTLTFISDHFQNLRLLRALRIASMLVMVVLQCLAFFPIVRYRWTDDVMVKQGCLNASSCPALNVTAAALWKENSDLVTSISTGGFLSYVLIVSSYIWQATMLFKKASYLCRNIIRKPLFFLEQMISHTAAIRTLKPLRYHTLLGLYFFFLALVDLVTSFAFFLWIMFIYLAWGTFELFFPRYKVLPACVRGEVDRWKFGQMVPVLMLLTPVYGVVGYFLGERKVETRECEDDNERRGREEETHQSTARLEPALSVPPTCSISTLFLNLHSEQDQSHYQHTIPQDTLRGAMYDILYFKAIIVLFCLLVVGSAVVFIAENLVGVSTMPGLVASAAGLVVIFGLAVVGGFAGGG